MLNDDDQTKLSSPRSTSVQFTLARACSFLIWLIAKNFLFVHVSSSVRRRLLTKQARCWYKSSSSSSSYLRQLVVVVVVAVIVQLISFLFILLCLLHLIGERVGIGGFLACWSLLIVSQQAVWCSPCLYVSLRQGRPSARFNLLNESRR